MSAKPDLWMPLYIADYLADTQDLSCEEHGAYFLLLMSAWMRGGRLPADERKLANIARCNAAQWKRVRGVLDYFDLDGDEYVQARLMAEYERAVKVNEAQKANGKKGGRPRKSESQEKPMGFDSDSPRGKPNETPPPLPLQAPKAKKETEGLKPLPPMADGGNAGTLVGSFEGHGDVPRETPNPAAKFAIALTRAGFPVTPINPRLVAYVEAGGTVDHLTLIAAMPDCAGKSAGYALAYAMRELTEPKAASVESVQNKNQSTAAAWAAQEPA